MNTNPAPILSKDGILARLKECIQDKGKYGARKIARELHYFENYIWVMVSRKTISAQLADYLGYEKVTLFVRKDIMKDPDKLWMLCNGKGAK